MNAMAIAIETDATARLIEGYLVEHMFETPPQADPDEPLVSAYVPLRVGPFRFLCAAEAVDVAPPATPATLVIDAADHVFDGHAGEVGDTVEQLLADWPA